LALVYELSKQFPFKVEEIIAKFAHEKDAVEYMNDRLDKDHKTKVDTTWRLYHQSEVIREVAAAKFESKSASDVGSGKSFSPTPLATSPKPAGSIPFRNSLDDDDV
jgi:hypothetical protein